MRWSRLPIFGAPSTAAPGAASQSGVGKASRWSASQDPAAGARAQRKTTSRTIVGSPSDIDRQRDPANFSAYLFQLFSERWHDPT